MAKQSKETISISKFQEGDAKIISKVNNNYVLSEIDKDNPYLSDYKNDMSNINLASEFFKGYMDAFESASYKQEGLKNYYDLVAKESLYSQRFSKVDLEMLSKLCENAQNDLNKILQLNGIVDYYINTDDLIGRVVETVENNVNKSYSIKKKTNTTDTMMETIKKFCEQVDIEYIIQKNAITTFSEGTTIMYLMGNPKDGWHISFYPLGICEITDIEIDHEPIVVMNVTKLRTRIQKSLSKYFTTTKMKEKMEKTIEAQIEKYYPPEVYEGYLAQEHYVPLDPAR